MKYFLVFAFLLGFSQTVQSIGILDFLGGFIIGLHIDNLSPLTLVCENDLEMNVKVFTEVINEFKKDHTLFEYTDILTKALWYVPDPFRSCINAPREIWKNFVIKFLEEFNYDLVEYLHTVFINIGEKTDRIIDTLKLIYQSFKSGQYYDTGYYTGDLVNVVLNVTNFGPKGNSYQFEFPALPSIDWDTLHEYFVKYVGYAIVSLNYTKWVDTVHVNELNISMLSTELKIYEAIKDFGKSNILEGCLKIIDTLKFTNLLFRGSYFTVVQSSKKILKDSIFEHTEHALDNLLQHVGYFIWDGYKLAIGIKEKDIKEILRRGIIIIRKILYFDEDALDDILTEANRIKRKLLTY